MLRMGAAAGLLLLAGCSAQPEASPFISGSCPTAVDSAAVNLISAQQQAFAKGDFANARTYASEEFQSAVDLDQFTEIIESQYSFLLKDPGLEFTSCDLLRGKAYMTVLVKSSPQQTMTYTIVPQGDTWRIDAAIASESNAVSA